MPIYIVVEAENPHFMYKHRFSTSAMPYSSCTRYVLPTTSNIVSIQQQIISNEVETD